MGHPVFDLHLSLTFFKCCAADLNKSNQEESVTQHNWPHWLCSRRRVWPSGRAWRSSGRSRPWCAAPLRSRKWPRGGGPTGASWRMEGVPSGHGLHFIPEIQRGNIQDDHQKHGSCVNILLRDPILLVQATGQPHYQGWTTQKDKLKTSLVTWLVNLWLYQNMILPHSSPPNIIHVQPSLLSLSHPPTRPFCAPCDLLGCQVPRAPCHARTNFPSDQPKKIVIRNRVTNQAIMEEGHLSKKTNFPEKVERFYQLQV